MTVLRTSIMHFPSSFSLMLTAAILLNLSTLLVAHSSHHHYLKHWHFTTRDQNADPTTTVTPCSTGRCVTAIPHLPCEAANGTDLNGPRNSRWTMVCDVDFRAQDIYPFILSGSFEVCLQHCDDYNTINGLGSCAGFVFAPDRVNLDNDCYLKSSLNDAIYPSTIHLIGATLQAALPTSQTIKPAESKTTSTENSTPSVGGYLNPDQIQAPSVRDTATLGTSIDSPTTQFVSHPPSKSLRLSQVDVKPGIDIDLITKYPLASDTGSWTSSSFLFDHKLTDMKLTPRISRDGGRGGIVNGTHIFIFCDTSTYGDEKDPVLGYLNSFVSSSVAVDNDMNGIQGIPLTLTDPVGQWQDDVGRMRGWIPMTTGEQAFNYAISGEGYRYAVWPESSPITINATHAILYAPLVYLDVDMETQSRPTYTNLGNTLVLISIDPEYGPHADRLVNQFFTEEEVGWGSLGGLRAWSSAGQTSSDGEVYFFGQVDDGIVVGKVGAQDFEDRSKYVYWNGNSWTGVMPPQDSTTNALMVNQSVMDLDVIYSPHHKTFIMVYLTPEADNNFYYRFLQDKDGFSLNITPAYEQGGDENYVDQIVMNKWSDQKLLFSVPPPDRGYIYAGGLHAGYFGGDDVTMGGTKMLCTWTEHTKVDPEKPESGYALKAQVVELS